VAILLELRQDVPIPLRIAQPSGSLLTASSCAPRRGGAFLAGAARSALFQRRCLERVAASLRSGSFTAVPPSPGPLSERRFVVRTGESDDRLAQGRVAQARGAARPTRQVAPTVTIDRPRQVPGSACRSGTTRDRLVTRGPSRARSWREGSPVPWTAAASRWTVGPRTSAASGCCGTPRTESASRGRIACTTPMPRSGTVPRALRFFSVALGLSTTASTLQVDRTRPGHGQRPSPRASTCPPASPRGRGEHDRGALSAPAGLGSWTYAFAPHGHRPRVRDLHDGDEDGLRSHRFSRRHHLALHEDARGRGLAAGLEVRQPWSPARGSAWIRPSASTPGRWPPAITFLRAGCPLLFFFTVMVVLGVLQAPASPSRELLSSLAAAFFAFHLLLAYLVDHLNIHASFLMGRGHQRVPGGGATCASWADGGFAVLRAGRRPRSCSSSSSATRSSSRGTTGLHRHRRRRDHPLRAHADDGARSSGTSRYQGFRSDSQTSRGTATRRRGAGQPRRSMFVHPDAAHEVLRERGGRPSGAGPPPRSRRGRSRRASLREGRAGTGSGRS